VAARLAELAEEYGLGPRTIDQLAALLHHLSERTVSPAAPTSIRDPVRAVDVHVADSLSGLVVRPLREARRIADVGAGAGFPGLVLACALPSTHIDLLDGAARRCAFMTAAAANARIGNVSVATTRAEDWTDGLGACDAVTCRAVAALPVLAEYAAPLLRIGGVLVAWKGRVDHAEEANGVVAAARLGLEPRAAVEVTPYPASRQRHLYVYCKVSSTPPGYPRRAGTAAKRPLVAETSQRSSTD
jgi:16S rRNA (guanine527-N7)-methyltransferase